MSIKIFDLIFESFSGSDKIVYHGSDIPDLEELEPNSPSYEGGLGWGIYTDFDINVARFYGKFIYEVKIDLNDNDILYISPEADGIDFPDLSSFMNNSILMGEYIPPFSFITKNGTRYFVGSGRYEIPQSDLDRFLTSNNLINSITNLKVNEIDPSINFKEDVLFDDLFDLEKIKEDNFYFDDYEDWLSILSYPFSEDEELLEEISFSSNLENFILQKSKEAYKNSNSEKIYGLSISLEDISGEASYAGYKAIHFEGMRGGSGPNSELLILDDSIIKEIKRIE